MSEYGINERKRQFIASYADSDIRKMNAALDAFTRLKKYEDATGKDLCEITQAEFRSLTSHNTLNYLSKDMDVLVGYLNWSADHRANNGDGGVKAVLDELLRKYAWLRYSSPQELHSCMNAVLDPESAETIDNVYRAYIWLGFIGVDMEDIFSITQRHIDLNKRVVLYGKERLEIYDEAFDAIRNVTVLDKFQYFHPNYNEVIYRDRVTGDEILRGVKGNFNTHTLSEKISGKTRLARKKTADPVKPVSFQYAAISGLNYRTYRLEKMGIADVDFSDFAVKEIRRNKGKYKNEKDAAKDIAAARERDYAVWKIAFNLK